MTHIQFDFGRLGSLLSQDVMAENRYVIESIANGQRFFVIDRDLIHSENLTINSLWSMQLVSEEGFAASYRFLELATGQFFLSNGEPPLEVKPHERQLWSSYFDRSQTGTRIGFSTWLSLLFENQFLGFRRLSPAQYYPFRLAQLIKGGTLDQVTISNRSQWPAKYDRCLFTLSTPSGHYSSGVTNFLIEYLGAEAAKEHAHLRSLPEVRRVLSDYFPNLQIEDWRRPVSPVTVGQPVRVMHSGRPLTLPVEQIWFDRIKGQWLAKVFVMTSDLSEPITRQVILGKDQTEAEFKLGLAITT